MVNIFLICCISFILGAFTGSKLASKGIRADKRLEKQQGIIFLWGLMAVSLVLFCLILIDQFNFIGLLPSLVPAFFLLYLGEYATQVLFALGCFVLGLLIILELPGRRSFRRMGQLFIAIVTIVPLLGILLYFSVPVIGMVGEPKIINGVVIQTSSYTCAPASIATLARFIGKHPNITEREVAKLTNTDKFGTRTLSEIRAMHKLGLEPEYKSGLKLEDLVKISRPALLHVREKDREGNYISHAVALLAVDSEKELALIGNPLYGIQIKTFKRMKTYWRGEAIFVKANHKS